MQFEVTPDHPCLPGHFPGHPVVPGVVVLEHVIEAIEAVRGPLRSPRLAQAKFPASLLPGQTARIELSDAGPSRWRFRVLHGDTLVASGEFADGART